MKSFFKFVPAALALMALASCSENDLLGESNVVEKVKGGLTVEVEQLGGDVTRQGNATYNGQYIVASRTMRSNNNTTTKLTMYDEYKFKADEKVYWCQHKLVPTSLLLSMLSSPPIRLTMQAGLLKAPRRY